MGNALIYLARRFSEPSSWSGIAALALLFGLDSDKASATAQALGSLAALVAVLVPESRGRNAG